MILILASVIGLGVKSKPNDIVLVFSYLIILVSFVVLPICAIAVIYFYVHSLRTVQGKPSPSLG